MGARPLISGRVEPEVVRLLEAMEYRLRLRRGAVLAQAIRKLAATLDLYDLLREEESDARARLLTQDSPPYHPEVPDASRE